MWKGDSKPPPRVSSYLSVFFFFLFVDWTNPTAFSLSTFLTDDCMEVILFFLTADESYYGAVVSVGTICFLVGVETLLNLLMPAKFLTTRFGEESFVS